MYDWTHDSTIACVRVGGDLQVVVNVERATDEARRERPIGDANGRRYIVHLFDSDSNPILQLGAFLNEAQAFAMLPTLVQIAREARGPGLMADFDMVKWTYLDETTHEVEWAGGTLDVDICNTIGI